MQVKLNWVKAFLTDCFLWSYSVLVIYKIVYQQMILDLRYSDFFWSQPIYSLGIGIGLATLFFFLDGFSIGKRVTGLYLSPFSQATLKTPFVYIATLVVLLTFLAGFHFSQVSLYEFLSESGIEGAKKIFIALVSPNFTILEETIFAAIETIYMAFIATMFSLPFAFVLSFFAARNLMKGNAFLRMVYVLTRFVLNITRSIEPLVWAIILSVWVGIGPFAGMLALCVHSVVSLAKLYSEQIETINDGPLEAMIATGAHPIQVIWFGVVPQIVLPFLSYTIYKWDINVRMATIIGLVGGGGIGTLLMQYQGLAKWHEVGLIVMIIALIVWIMDYSSAKIREAIK